jgi:hypothetical protein
VSKRAKLLQKLQAIPKPTDFTWEELITLMRWAKFREECSGGSHYIFEHETGFRFSMSKSHPSGILKGYQVKAAIEALIKVEVIGE